MAGLETRCPPLGDIWRRRGFGAFVVDKSLFGIGTMRASGRIGSWTEEKLMIPLITVRGDLTHFQERAVATGLAVVPPLARSPGRGLRRSAARRAA